MNITPSNNPANARPHQESGFILIEILVAIALCGTLAAITMGLMNNTFLVSDYLYDRMESHRIANLFFKTVREQLHCHLFVPLNEDSLQITSLGSGKKAVDGLSFFTTIAFGQAEPEFRNADVLEVSYFLEANDDTYNLFCQEGLLLGATSTLSPKQLMSEQVSYLDITCSKEPDNWLESWDLIAQESPPAMIAIAVGFVGPRTGQIFDFYEEVTLR